jgi:hypothetical protein
MRNKKAKKAKQPLIGSNQELVTTKLVDFFGGGMNETT